MTAAIAALLAQLKDPKKELSLARKGLKANVVEAFLTQEGLAIKDVLARLDIPASTYFGKKKNQKNLDAYTTEKFIRLILVTVKASKILGESEVKGWLYKKIPSLGNEVPIDLLDTEAGHRLVEQALLRIEYGVYG
jgi:putative toxin-antitoxin system antitoxin component (TIGR02293 family)